MFGLPLKVLISITLLAVIALAGCSKAAAKEVNLQFANHLQMGMPEQDVFLEKKGGPANQVVRVEGNEAKDSTILSKEAYATASATPHDPFKVGSNPLGPYPKGVKLGFKLQQWLDASGSGTYTVTGNDAELKLSFDKLVHDATYTVWCSRLSFPPTPKVVDTPCGKADGSQNSLKTDKNGKATFSVKMPKLVDSSKETASVIALAYHSDGKTWGASPGEFGKNSHVQIVALVPTPDDKGWMTK